MSLAKAPAPQDAAPDYNEEALARHPGAVARDALCFYRSLSFAPATKRLYGDVLSLFIGQLIWAGEAKEASDGTLLSTTRWARLAPEAPVHFVDIFLPKKFMGPPEIHARAPGVLRKFFKWALDEGRIDRSAHRALTRRIGPAKAREIRRLQAASDLLYRLHQPDPGASFRGDETVVPMNRRRRPQAFAQGYMRLTALDGARGTLDDNGDAIGPVELGPALAEQLRVGDVLCVELGRYGDVWQVIGSGNVYSESAGEA